MHQVAGIEVRRISTPALVLDDSHGRTPVDITRTPGPDDNHLHVVADATPVSSADKSHAYIFPDTIPTPAPDDNHASILTDAIPAPVPAPGVHRRSSNIPTNARPAPVPYNTHAHLSTRTTPGPACNHRHASTLTDTRPAPIPNNSEANIPAHTPAAPSYQDNHTNRLVGITPASCSISAEPVEDNKERVPVRQEAEPRSLYQQPLKSPSEPTLSMRKPEWDLSRERLAAELLRLHHPFVPPQDDLAIHATSVSGLYDGHHTALAGPSLAVGTVHMPCNDGRACDNLVHYRRNERGSRNSSAATIIGQRAEVYAPAPHGGAVDDRQDSSMSSEDAGAASGSIKAPNIGRPYRSGRSRGPPQGAKRWDQNIKQNRVHRWLWVVLPDLIIMSSLFLAAIFMNKRLDNFRWMTRKFPMTWDQRTGTWVGPVEISWPQDEFIVPILTAEILIPLIPTLILLGMQLWVKNFWDFNAAIFGLFKGIGIVTLLQIIFKSFIGEFRPYFMSACTQGGVFGFTESARDPGIRFISVSQCPVVEAAMKSVVKRVPLGGNSHSGDPNHWTFSQTKEYKTLRFAMQSFPSGHTIEAFCAGVFLSLYLNAKLKACSDYHTSFWKLMVVLSPTVGAAFIAASVVVDHNHHFHDVFLSIPIGVLVGLLAYRTHFMSIFDYHTNHLYLPWSSLHRCVNSTVPTPPIARDTRPGYRFKSKFRHKTAVAWPRREETQGPDNGQETGTVGLDGTRDGKPGRSRRSRMPRTLKKGMIRQSLFPKGRPTSNDAVRSIDGVSPMIEVRHSMTPAGRPAQHLTTRRPQNSAATGRGSESPRRDVPPALTPNIRAAERVAVDDWHYGGRPSDMV